MSARRWPWCLPTAPALPKTRLSAIEVDIEPLPAVANWQSAAKNETLLFENKDSNVTMKFRAVLGDAAAAFKDAPYTRRESFSTQRHTALPMEPRGLLAEWDAASGRLTLSGAAKVLFANRRILAKQLGLAVDAIDMVEYDVGGSFGARGEFYPEDFLIPFAARHVGRPVKWTEDRREHLMTMNHAREAACDVEIACARDGTILGLRGHAFVDMGAYMRTNGAVGARNIAQFMSGPYRVANIDLDVSLLLTNKTPVGTYRGPGRFETDFFRERLLDMAARDLGIDQIEFRRRNLVREADMPYKVATIAPFEHKDELDSGDYQVTLDRCLAEFGWAEKEKLKGKLIDGRYHGLAVCCFIEGGAAGPKESARLVLETNGTLTVYMGSSGVGQGLGDGIRANRRRRHGHADGPHQPRVPRLDGLCQRRLRLLSLALDRDGRLGGARCRDKIAGGHERRSGAPAQLRRQPRSCSPTAAPPRPTANRCPGRSLRRSRCRSKARFPTTSTPGLMARTPPMSRSIQKPARSRSSIMWPWRIAAA